MIGTELLPLLLKEHKVVVFGRSLGSFPQNIRTHKFFKFYECDLALDQIPKITDPIDCIVHLAGLVSTRKSSPDDYVNLNIVSTTKLISFAKEKKIKNFIFASSASVYGHQSGKKLSETDRLLGRTEYAISKIDAEYLLLKSQLNCTILRIASVFGKHSKGFISKLRVLLRKGIEIQLKDERKKSFIYISDLTEFIQKIIESPKKGIYNLAHPESIEFKELIFSLKKKTKSKVLLKITISDSVLKLFNIANLILRKIRFTKSHSYFDIRPLIEQTEINPELAIKEFGYVPVISIKSDWE